MTINFDGSTFQEDELTGVVLKIKAHIAMLEGVQYSSHMLVNEFEQDGLNLRDGLDDCISDLRAATDGIEGAIGTVTPPAHATDAAIAQTLEALTGIRANLGEGK